MHSLLSWCLESPSSGYLTAISFSAVASPNSPSSRIFVAITRQVGYTQAKQVGYTRSKKIYQPSLFISLSICSAA